MVRRSADSDVARYRAILQISVESEIKRDRTRFSDTNEIELYLRIVYFMIIFGSLHYLNVCADI